MTRHFFSVAFCCIVFHCQLLRASGPGDFSLTDEASQHSLLYKTSSTTYFPCLSARIGIMDVDIDKLNAHYQAAFNQVYSYNPLTIGLTYEYPIRIRKGGSYDSNVDLTYLVPQDLKVGNLEEAVFQGFSFGLGIGRDVFPGNRHFDMIVSSGFQTGFLRVRYTDYTKFGVDDIARKPFFAPQLTIYPKLILGYLVVGLRASYRYDFLNGSWGTTPIAQSYGVGYATGYTLEGVIGVQLGIYR